MPAGGDKAKISGMEYTKVSGINKGHVRLYALSTCIWCKKTRELLEQLGVEYEYIYADLLSEEEQDELLDELEKYNPMTSFPTLVIDEKESVWGYKPQEVRKLLG